MTQNVFDHSTDGQWAVTIPASNGAYCLQVTNSDTDDGYGIVVYTDALNVPSILGNSDGYYAISGINTAWKSTGNGQADCIGLVGHSLYSNGAYIEQGGTSQQVEHTNPYAALYVCRTIEGSVPDYAMDGPIAEFEDTTDSNGDLLRLTKVSVLKFSVTKLGEVRFRSDQMHTSGGNPVFYFSSTTNNIYAGSDCLNIVNQADNETYLKVKSGRLTIPTSSAPSTSSSTGVTGSIAWDTNYLYVCTATNTWKRTALSTW